MVYAKVMAMEMIEHLRKPCLGTHEVDILKIQDGMRQQVASQGRHDPRVHWGHTEGTAASQARRQQDQGSHDSKHGDQGYIVYEALTQRQQ